MSEEDKDVTQGETTAPSEPEGKEEATESLDDQWGEAMAEQETAAPAPEPAGAGAGAPAHTPAPPQPSASPASFGALQQGNVGSGSSLDMILDIPVTVAVELGRTRMLVQDLLALGQGAVVELEKLAGETMEILVNGRLIARGEAVVVNEKFGVKLTDIVSPTERINRLK